MNDDEMAEELAGFNMAHTSIHSRTDELIACLEGEIAKRDETIARLEPQLNRAIQANYDLREELGACRAAVENCELFRNELAAIKAQEPVAEIALSDDGYKIGLLGALRNHRLPLGTKLYATPVSEAKAQGVVMPERETELFNAAYGAAVESGWESVKCMARQIWDAARLNAAPAAPAADARLVEALELAANRLDRLALEHDDFWRGYANMWVREARAALAAHRAKGVV